jgi:hypothetical protein
MNFRANRDAYHPQCPCPVLAMIVNNIAVAFVVAGFVAPAVSGRLPDTGRAVVTLAWIGIGIALHFIAQPVLGALRQ